MAVVDIMEEGRRPRIEQGGDPQPVSSPSLWLEVLSLFSQDYGYMAHMPTTTIMITAFTTEQMHRSPPIRTKPCQ